MLADPVSQLLIHVVGDPGRAVRDRGAIGALQGVNVNAVHRALSGIIHVINRAAAHATGGGAAISEVAGVDVVDIAARLELLGAGALVARVTVDMDRLLPEGITPGKAHPSRL